MPAYAVEKDWWVVQTLSIIFEMQIGKHLVFKGGTSLSKAWGLIDRFSEDIDLAVDRAFLGFEGELTRAGISRLRKVTSTYLSETFYPEIQQKFKDKGLDGLTFKIVEAKSSDQDPRIIEIYYPQLIESPGYIKPRIQVEIGCRSLIEPFNTQTFSSLIDEHYKTLNFAQGPISIPTVNPERTFLEKIFLLQEEFQKPIEKIRVDRLSRHLYDVFQLSKTEFAEKAIYNSELYETIVNHRHTFTRVAGVDYNLHQPQTVNPIPPVELMKAWEADYKTMQEEMIYGDSPSFRIMLESIKLFVTKINNLKWKINTVF